MTQKLNLALPEFALLAMQLQVDAAQLLQDAVDVALMCLFICAVNENVVKIADDVCLVLQDGLHSPLKDLRR